MAADWAQAMAPVEPRLREIGQRLRAEAAAGHRYLPHNDAILRAFARPLADVRVLLIGQDPYPTPGHAVGLSFSVAPHVRPLPRSLQNIVRELRDDVGGAPPDGDLSGWAEQGVMLLNRTLTVREGAPGSHRDLGWAAITDRAVQALAERGGPLVAVLWGREAGRVRPLLGEVPVVAGVHPSPLSASRGFFGSRPFSRVNTLLQEQGAPPVDWCRPAGAGRHHADVTGA
ncbi:uracil-DNA glycosylase [Cellulomonas bogoriensis]